MQILAGFVLLGILIVFHELGHFLFAKMLGVKVLVFSVGFGPKLVGIKIGDTEYRLSAIPLGGYVRMFGESLEEELTDAEKKMSFMHQAIWRKSLIAVAGPLFNFILPIVLFFGLIVGHEQIFIPRIGTLLPGSVAEKAGLLPDDKILAVDGKNISSFSEMAEIVAEHPARELKLTIERTNEKGESHRVVIPITPEAKPSSNPLEKDKLVGRIGVMPAIEQPIVVLTAASALKSTALRDYDEIIEIDGKAIASARALVAALDDMWPGSVLKARRAKDGALEEFQVKVPNLGLQAVSASEPIIKNLRPEPAPEAIEMQIANTKELLQVEAKSLLKNWGVAPAKSSIVQVSEGGIAASLGLVPGDRVIAINGERLLSSVHLQQNLLQNSAAPQVLGIMSHKGEALVIIFSLPDHIEENLKLDADLASIFGLTMPEVFKAGEAIERQVGPLEALKRATVQTYSIVAMTGKSLWLLVKGDVPASQVGGPIQLFDVAQQAANKGLAYYLFIMCLLSVNLGLLNLLPIPALDGGHLLLFGIEAIQRKPLTIKTRAIATQMGVALLLCVMGLAIFNDISRLFR